MTNKYPFIPLPNVNHRSAEALLSNAREYYEHIKLRRTVRDYSAQAIPREVIEQCLLAAGTAPNGANLQPWHFAVVQSPEIKSQIRSAAEKEEREFYAGKAPQDWLDALAPLGTDAEKPFLEIAPYLIVIFAKTHDILPDGRRLKHYYVNESVGIATGFLINALHHAGLVTLTHTPSPMKFLNQILDRPSQERPYLILVVGHPAADAMVPDISKKPLDQIASFH